MDYAALAGTNRFLHRRIKQSRLLFTALAASLFGMCLVLTLKNYQLYVLLTHFLIGPLMVWLAFGTERWYAFLENWGVCYLMLLLLGGLWEGINQWNVQIANVVTKGAIVLFFFRGGVCYLARRKNYGQKVYRVWLKQGSQKICVNGFWDSGNQLVDCYTNQPVQILAYDKIKLLYPTESLPYRLVPYAALGKKNGLLKVVSIDEITIELEKTSKKISPAVIGLAEEGELDAQKYEMILHAAAIESACHATNKKERSVRK